MWWEFDWVYMLLRMLGAVGIVWDMKVPTDEVKASRYKNLDKRTVPITRLYQIECRASAPKPNPVQLL